MPNWYLGGQLAKSLLDESDPGYRYWKRVNVQCSDARLANANFGAFACIVAQPVTALDMNGPDQTFDWLLAGSLTDSQKIHGSTGLCPKLLHTFAQVTHLTIRMARVSHFNSRAGLGLGCPLTTALRTQSPLSFLMVPRRFKRG